MRSPIPRKSDALARQDVGLHMEYMAHIGFGVVVNNDYRSAVSQLGSAVELDPQGSRRPGHNGIAGRVDYGAIAGGPSVAYPIGVPADVRDAKGVYSHGAFHHFTQKKCVGRPDNLGQLLLPVRVAEKVQQVEHLSLVFLRQKAIGMLDVLICRGA